MIWGAAGPSQSYNLAMERPLLLLIRAGLMLVLLVPLVVTSAPLPNTYFPYIVGKALYGRFVIEVVFGLWVILIITYPKYRPPRSWVLTTFALFLMGSLIAALAGVSITRSLWSTYERMQGVVDLLHWFGFVLVAASVLRSFASWRTFLNANVVVSVVVALLGFSQRYGHLLFDEPLLPYLVNRDRIDITLGNPTFVGAYMLVALLTALALLAYSFERAKQGPATAAAPTSRRRRRRRQRQQQTQQFNKEWLWRGFWVLAVALDFVVLLMAGARGALIGLSVTLALVAIVFIIRAVMAGTREGSIAAALRYLFTGPTMWLKAGSVLAMVLILAGLLTLVLARDSGPVQRLAGSNRMVAQLAAFGTGEDSTATRLYAVRMGLVGFAQRPLVGWGPENFAVAYDRNVGAERFSNQAESYDQAHNKVVEELTTKGLVGFVPFATMWLLVAWAYLKTLRRPGGRAWHFTLMMGAATLGYFVQNLFLFDTPATSLQIFVLIGFAAALGSNLQRDPELVGESAAEGEAGDGAEDVSGEREVPLFSGLPSIGPDHPLRVGGAPLLRLWKMPEFNVPLAFGAVALAVIFLTALPFIASQRVIDTFSPTLTVNQRLNAFAQSINTFSALGNYPRVLMFESLTERWSTMTPGEQQQSIQFALDEFDNGIDAEPEQWRIYVAASVFFQVASDSNPQLLDLARELVEESVRLAPERVETISALARQFLFEEDLPGAQATINGYLRLNPESRFLLDGLISVAFPEGGAG